VCFKDRKATLPEFLDAVRSHWKGPRGEELRLAALDAPYWGDNSPESNGLQRWLFETVARDLDGLRNDQGSPFVLAAWVYREFLFWGLKTKATPDGRRDGDRLAQGFAPSEYRCKAATTTVMNAIGTLPHELLYASNANLMFDGTGMTPELFASVFRVFAQKRAHLLQPNCHDVETLLDAQKHPERHQDIIVRVCGFSARFVSLSKLMQDEVIARHRLKQRP
jgi:formate C-acetyltransferase